LFKSLEMVKYCDGFSNFDDQLSNISLYERAIEIIISLAYKYRVDLINVRI
jgi:hypothetical protein